MENAIKLKRVVIKEELVELTGNYVDAILLQQFIYWSERTRDVDRYIKEEKDRCQKYGEQAVAIEKSHGWIYKSAEELSNETMIGLTPSSIRRHLKELISKGWLNSRNNPRYKWDRTIQYRVDIIKIQRDLFSLGYALEGYNLNISTLLILENGISEMENQGEDNQKAIPEITSDITSQTTNIEHRHFPVENVCTLSFEGKRLFDFYQTYYEAYTGEEHKPLSDKTISRINELTSTLSIFDEETEDSLEVDESYLLEMVKKYFSNNYNCDRNINHFLNEKILRNLYYQANTSFYDKVMNEVS